MNKIPILLLLFISLAWLQPITATSSEHITPPPIPHTPLPTSQQDSIEHIIVNRSHPCPPLVPAPGIRVEEEEGLVEQVQPTFCPYWDNLSPCKQNCIVCSPLLLIIVAYIVVILSEEL